MNFFYGILDTNMAHPFDWKVLKSQYIVKDTWLTVRADTCELPSLNTIDPYYVFEYPTWINVVALTTRDDMVLVRLYRHGIGKTVLELPSGRVDTADDFVLSAARRELLEETGYGGGKWVETGRLSPNPANHTNMVHSFLATGVETVSEPIWDETERVEIILMPLTDAVELVRKNGFFQALHVGSLFFALDHLGKVEFI